MQTGVTISKLFLGELMQRFNILDPHLNIMESRFLEASAGTGKTFAIEHLFARLVQEKKIEGREILAVTFTKEAAHEMKTRIRKKLKTDEELPIFTIHGFCHKMLTEFAFEARAPLKLASLDKLHHLFEMEQVVEDFFRTANPNLATEVSILLRKNRYNIKGFIRTIVQAMEKAEKPVDVVLNPPSFSLEELSREYALEAPKYKYLNIEKYADQVEKYIALRHPSQLLLEKEWFFEKMYPENVKKGANPKRPNPFDELRKGLMVARDAKEMLKRIAWECRKRWLVKAKRSGCHSFDELLHNMNNALSIERFRKKVQDKFKAVIVDEFQDTDPVQWQIFKTLFLETHLLYLVGDPKQSIYAFRNADIYTYIEAGKALGEEKKAFLDTNFRSSPSLIEALNRLFTKDPSWIELPSLPSALAYHPVQAGRSESKLNEPPIQGFLIEGVLGRERSWPTKEMEQEKIFPYIAREIIRLHTIQGIPLSEMSILIKDRYQGQRLQLYLKTWNIPSGIRRTLHLAESRGFDLMERVLRATLHPESEKNVRAVFLEENPFYMLRGLFAEHGFATYFAHFVDHHFQGDRQLLIELKQTAEVLMERYGATLFELLHFMQQLKALDPEEDERLKLRDSVENDRVSIMTTFASKGLEFDVIFALGLAYRTSSIDTEELKAEKMRQLYVAFTRPREKLYIPIIQPMEGNSPLEYFFKNWTTFDFPIETVESIPVSPLTLPSYEDLEEKGPSFVFHFPIQSLHSFTSLAKPTGHFLVAEQFFLQDLSKKTPHTLPLGAETGTLIHTVFEKHFNERHVPLEQIVMETFLGTHLEGWEEVVAEMAEGVLSMSLDQGFSLQSLRSGEYIAEMEFLFPKESNQLIKGFVDLVFRREDTFYLLDWKTNWLGPTDAHYTEEKLKLSMKEHDYYLQARLYHEALTRFVKRLYKEPTFGGAYYIFVRGKKGVHVELS